MHKTPSTVKRQRRIETMIYLWTFALAFQQAKVFSYVFYFLTFPLPCLCNPVSLSNLFFCSMCQWCPCAVGLAILAGF